MSRLSGLMDIGRRSLMNSQLGLQTTSHNIANQSTEGYSRQRIEQVANVPVGKEGLQIGTGARVLAVRATRNDYLEKQINNESEKGGFAKASAEGLMRTEQVFNEQINKGLNRFVSEFFNSFRELANSPESLAARTLVKETAIAMTDDFHRIHRQLRDVQFDLDNQIRSTITEINGIAEEIASLNEKVSTIEIQGGTANDERDRRNLLIQRLSEKVNIRHAENEDGQVNISVGDTAILVSGFDHMSLSVAPIKGDEKRRDGNLDIYYKFSEDADPVNITRQIRSGEIAGSLHVRDDIIHELLNDMDELAFKISREVNREHVGGVDRYSNPGNLFFNILSQEKDAAEFIKIDNAIYEDSGKIVAGFAEGGPADNRVANRIAAIQSKEIMRGNFGTVDDFYNGLVGELAVITKKNNMKSEHQGNIVDQLKNIRESISGVSLDEETTKMIELQKQFDASARMIRTADEMFETVLSLKRL